jgi:hypothetical protein
VTEVLLCRYEASQILQRISFHFCMVPSEKVNACNTQIGLRDRGNELNKFPKLYHKMGSEKGRGE